MATTDARHPKRSFLKYRTVDSPAYDASEEDNDPLTDDGASVTSIPSPSPASTPAPRPQPRSTYPHLAAPTSSLGKAHSASRAKHQLAASLTAQALSDDGVDSPTYDGDIESSTTIGGGGRDRTISVLSLGDTSTSASGASALTSPVTSAFPLPEVRLGGVGLGAPGTGAGPAAVGAQTNESTPSVSPERQGKGREARDDDAKEKEKNDRLKEHSIPFCVPGEPAPANISKDAFDPAKLTTEDIQAFVKKAIEGESIRKYKINKPPTDRPVRIYADGVYDLFHFGHALQLRQAKLSFPSVYLLVGCCSDELVRQHKNPCVMNHAERCEAIRHCRWVDQVVPEAPWVITSEFLEKYEIDYVAHDEDPYAGAGTDDVYGLVKAEGKFLPTRRTPGVSTSELLERIVQQYRHRDFDGKLEKMGRAELKAEGSDYDDDPDGPRSRAVSRVRGRKEQLKQDAKLNG
ncbi:hypothetical protein PUNSTDRAFT_115777 [Punctularia strigosozonata HHB-11173 SS5]|uniref:uncharacterized protein n=1 Tax=Punctularia strigosozonata (strain HHB-11173) TaxID=741275 RepID=UPI0004417630|nr:uncharacterized protein PUNSTDRAFT_115777 [Punctularia strigosozonata HHB-11173 SS5]EIN05869.1 hypothetical protein PUNSTDRAFT_115777 [Punctularia strigosozonata HHB-11173 SS5]